MTISFNAGEVLEHVQLNNMVLAANSEDVASKDASFELKTQIQNTYVDV